MSRVLAMDPNATLKWVPKVDRDLPEKEQFTILYHPLDMRADAKFNDDQIRNITKGRKSKMEYLVNQIDVKRMEEAITGWENFDYPDGKPVPFSKENIATIPPEIRGEFVTHITGRDRAKDEEDSDGNEDLGEAQVG